MDESTYGPVRELLARTATDADLCSRVLADPIAAIREVAGVDLPSDWRLEGAVGQDGAVVLTFADDELPMEVLESVGGGVSTSYSFPPIAGIGSFADPYRTR